MKKFRSCSLFLACLALAACHAACTGGQPYHGPTIGRVDVNGTYTDKDGESFGGGVGVDLDYPTPTPAPRAAVDHSK